MLMQNAFEHDENNTRMRMSPTPIVCRSILKDNGSQFASISKPLSSKCSCCQRPDRQGRENIGTDVVGMVELLFGVVVISSVPVALAPVAVAGDGATTCR
jgi:hypothetical protein